MEGRIVKAISEYYYVNVKKETWECKAKGHFKKDGITPLVGDYVSFDVLDTTYKYGMISEIKSRKNVIERPTVANVDQVMVVFAVKTPTPNFNLLDKFLAQMKAQNLPVIIVFNKRDLSEPYERKEIKKAYKDAGCDVFFTNANSQARRYLISLKMKLRGKTTVLTGPSGVGKSTLINALAKVLGEKGSAETGWVSERTGRGKQTTRHYELFVLPENINIIDTPGFSSLIVNQIDRAEIQNYFPEIKKYAGGCKFDDCMHLKEQDCAVKKAVEDKKIPESRYNSYKQMVNDAKVSYK